MPTHSIPTPGTPYHVASLPPFSVNSAFNLIIISPIKENPESWGPMQSEFPPNMILLSLHSLPPAPEKYLYVEILSSMEYHLMLEVEWAWLFPHTIANRTFMSPSVVALGRSMQGTSVFMIVTQSGIQLLETVLRGTISAGPETVWDSLSCGPDNQEGFERVRSYAPTMLTGNEIHNSDLNNTNYPQMVNHLAVVSRNENQENAGEMFNIMGQEDLGTHVDWQGAQLLPNASTAASQQPQAIFWDPPNVPNDFVPAPVWPSYNITFNEPVIFTAPPPDARQKGHSGKAWDDLTV
ncbi:hypothetical protein BDZ91DRAFT_842239 [Kalaharituber pfeilii]|nr:hypothetical protein BDZ91DRAFT_842239 [Kalaharituber pfeilii]